jgi:uncharacterized MAPEG superfamily protein
MSFALWMILVAILLPVVTAGIAKWGVPAWTTTSHGSGRNP